MRFVEKGIDLSQTNYLTNNIVYPGLIEALELSLKCQNETDEDVYITLTQGIADFPDDPEDPLTAGLDISIHRPKYAFFTDETPCDANNENGLAIVLNFLLDCENEKDLKLFKSLPSFSLYKYHYSERIFNCNEHNRIERVEEYYINFGQDAEGAARLISELIYTFRKFHGLNTNSLIPINVSVHDGISYMNINPACPLTKDAFSYIYCPNLYEWSDEEAMKVIDYLHDRHHNGINCAYENYLQGAKDEGNTNYATKTPPTSYSGNSNVESVTSSYETQEPQSSSSSRVYSFFYYLIILLTAILSIYLTYKNDH